MAFLNGTCPESTVHTGADFDVHAAMDDPEDVQRAIRHMNGRDWEGRRLNVELCRNPK